MSDGVLQRDVVESRKAVAATFQLAVEPESPRKAYLMLIHKDLQDNSHYIVQCMPLIRTRIFHTLIDPLGGERVGFYQRPFQ
jgi:hypothetical protein